VSKAWGWNVSKRQVVTRRRFIRMTAAAGATSLVVACLPQTPGASPEPSATVTTAERFPLGKVEGGEVVLDATKVPKQFKEAPELAALVQQGKLPPVADRIGQDPLVIRPVHGIGKYGGTLRRAFLSVSDGTAFRFAGGPDSLLYWDHAGTKVIPNVARAFELSSDGKVLTIQLRHGMKWSDGVPFTADDIMFWYQDMYLNRQVITSPSSTMQINGKDVVIERVDQLTIRFVSPEPNYLLPQVLASFGDLGGMSNRGDRGLGGIAPKHYLSKFHPKYTAQADVDRLVADARFPSWRTFFLAKSDWLINTELPVLTPWRTTVPSNNPTTFVMERNPYSIWVDTEGNQLPYIGTLNHTFAQNLEVVAVRAVGGELDFQDRHMDVAKLATLIDGQQRGGYKVHLDPSQDGLGIALNLAYEEDKEVGDLLRTADFRRALSLGIDRPAINETFFLGTGVLSSAAPTDDNRYFPGSEWRSKWSTLDLAQANGLLDKLGYTQKDSEGYRQRKDGKGRLRLDYQAAFRFTDFPAIGEMVKEQWKKIGIDLSVGTGQTTLLQERILANQLQMTGNITSSEDVFLQPDTIMPSSLTGFAAIIGAPYARWWRSGGREGKEPFKEMKELIQLYQRGYVAPEKERIEIGKEMFRLHVDQVFSIGFIVGGLSSYGLRYAKTNIGNMPARIVNTTTIRTTMNALPMTFYYK
jgi:peptide/nickel transport system substrate-binding protein